MYDKEAGTNMAESWLNELPEVKEIYREIAKEKAEGFEKQIQPLTDMFFKILFSK